MKCEHCGEARDRGGVLLLAGVVFGLVVGFAIGWFTVAERLGAM